MEKHETSAEVFAPMEGKSILLVASWKDVERPDMSRARAFLMDGCKGVLLYPGT
jgi:ureidoglycolate hydrolase